MKCSQCSSQLKAGMSQSVVVQKSMGLVMSDALRDEPRSGDTYVCPVCKDRSKRATPGGSKC